MKHLLLLLVILVGCNKPCRQIEFEKYSNSKGFHPIEVIRRLEDCSYSSEINLQFENSYLYSDFVLKRNEKKFFLILNEIELELFDLGSPALEKLINFSELNPKYPNVRTSLDSVYFRNSENVFQFRWKEATAVLGDDEVYEYDIVFFLTIEGFIIGSYVSKTYDDSEFYISPSGDILEDVIDYSEKELRIIH